MLQAACPRMRANGRSRPACRSTCRPRISATATSSTRCARRCANPGSRAHRLEIEVTETALLDDKSLTRALDRGTEGARRQDRARRFRHRLFEPELSAQTAARQGQDRPQLPDGRHPKRALARAPEGHRQPVAAARPERHGRRRRDLRAAEDPGARRSSPISCKASCSVPRCRRPASRRCPPRSGRSVRNSLWRNARSVPSLGCSPTSQHRGTHR